MAADLFKILLNDFVNFNVGSIKIPIIAITIINSIMYNLFSYFKPIQYLKVALKI